MKIIYTYKNHIHLYGELCVIELKEKLMYKHTHSINMYAYFRSLPILVPCPSPHPACPLWADLKGNQPVRKNQKLTNKPSHPSYLCIAYGNLHTIMECCYRNRMTHRPKTFTIWPSQEVC